MGLASGLTVPSISGENFTIDANNAGQDDLNSETFVYIYDLDGNLLQSIEFHTSCSQPLILGNQFGGIQLMGFADKDGAGAGMVPDPGSGGTAATDLCDDFGKPAQLVMLYTGDNILDHQQDDSKVNVSGDPAAAPTVRILVTNNDDPTDSGARVWFDGTVNLGENFTIDANNAGQDDLNSETFVYIYDLDGNLLQSIEFHTSCSQPLILGNQFGGIQLMGFADKDGAGAGMVPDPGSGGTAATDLCDDFGKPAQLVMLYTGDNILDHQQDDSKVNVSGDPAAAPTVRILVTNNDDPTDSGARVWFDGTVNLGENFTIDANNAGQDDLNSETFVYIYDLDGNLLQSIEFHTSCSQPLILGNQFGGIQLIGFVDRDGRGP